MQKEWYPTPVERYRNLLNFKCKYTLKSNIIYNLQYMEYILNKLKNESNTLTSNLISMNCKSYLISFISVIEAIFYIELKEKNILPTDEYEKVSQQDMIKKVGTTNIKISTIVYKKTTPFITEIKMDWLMKKIESSNVYPLLSHNNFGKIKNLKKLRNKVHLHLAKTPNESDYNSFNFGDIDMANEILINVLEKYSSNISDLHELPFNKKLCYGF